MISATNNTKALAASSTVDSLRNELKTWEKAFANANEGRKAGRDDIKNDPQIAQKYKDYAKLRARLSTKNTPPASSSSPPPLSKKRKIPPLENQPPTSFRPSHVHQTHSQHPSTLDPYESPGSLRHTLTPIHHRTSIGPTPQKNGKVLGLFDLLSPESASKRQTPSKRLSLLNPNLSGLQTTPSKHSIEAREFDNARPRDGNHESARRHSRTPQSSSKRMYLDSFLTPSTRRINEQRTPHSSMGGVSKLTFDGETPEFLRRDSQRAAFPTYPPVGSQADGDAVFWSPIKVRMPVKPAGRGLSALVKGLRGMQDEALDEDLDIMNELEAERAGGDGDSQILKQPKLLVRDSQLEMPLGPDGEGDVSNNEEESKMEGRGRDGKPLKVWKKKGQKRSTRRVNMKPNAGKWRPEPTWLGGKESEDDMAVQETQVGDAVIPVGLDAEGDGADAQDHEWDGAEGEGGSQGTKTVSLEAAPASVPKAKKKKKISATAHANFRALKIKNKQSKGKRGGKFGRRR
ncbi:MAG: hypothetical protein Q9187_001345 [Circinaria calcarea]